MPHESRPKGDLRSKVYDSRAWRRVRTRVLARDGHTCTRCGMPGNIVDHDPPLLRILEMGGDPLDETYLRTLCARCSGHVDGGRAAHRRKEEMRENRFLNTVLGSAGVPRAGERK